jgi:hypothetical protein
MLEIDCQKLVVDVVRARGGGATKLSNRFLVGIADLLIKIPEQEVLLAEAKLARFKRIPLPDHVFRLDVTVPQKAFLRAFRAAGARCGVLSFVEISGRGRLGLYLAWLGLDRLDAQVYYQTEMRHHQFIGETGAREEQVWRILRAASNQT